jgi:prepilin-type N-terminal cleavage/methylation domain-containing protein
MRRQAGSEQGFTIIEMLVSALLVAVIAAGLTLALIGSAHVTGLQRDESEADALAQQDQERLKGMSADQLSALGSSTRQVTLGTTGATGTIGAPNSDGGETGTTFNVISSAAFVNSSGSATCSASGTSSAAYYKATSNVWWGTPNASDTGPLNSNDEVQAQSVITPPVGGVLVVQVDDQTGAGLSGAQVAASGSDYASGTTDSNGCVVLAGLEEGSYTVTYTDSGYISSTGKASPVTESATLTDTGSGTPSGGNPLYMGIAGMVNAQFTTGESGSSCSGASPCTVSGQEADAFSWYGAGSSQSMSASSGYDPSTTPVGTLPSSGYESLYPFEFTGPSYTGNYQVWAGKCPQMEPPTGTDDASVSPGSTQTLTISEPALDVVVTFGGGRVAPGHVKLTFTSSSGTSCTDSWYAAVASNAASAATGSLAYPGQPFASTATSGSTESASKSTGSYSVCADYTSGGETYEKTVSGVTNTSFASATTVTDAITTRSSQGSC